MRLFPAPRSRRREGSLHVRLLALLAAALIAVGCTTGGGAGFTGAPQSSAGPSSAAPSAVASAVPSVPASGASASPAAQPSPSASTAPSASSAPSPGSSSAPSISPPSVPPSPVTYPLTLTDDENNTVVLKAEPKKIVSITPATTELLFALGIGDRLIANTDADDYPPQVKSLPHVATYNSIDVEKIVGLGADLVIAGGNGFNKPDSLAQLRRLGIPVLVVYAADVEGVLHDYELVARAVNQLGAGQGLITSVRTEFQSIAEKTRALPHPRTFYELDATKEIYGPADKSFIAEMITLAGGTPITTGSTTVFSIPLEKLVAADPEVIILGDAAYGTTAEIAAARPGWNTMTAVKNKAIRPIDDVVVSRPGPRLGQGLRDLALAIHPDLVLAEPSASPSPSFVGPSTSSGTSPAPASAAASTPASPAASY